MNEHEEDRVRRRTDKDKEVTRVAYRPSKRLRKRPPRAAENLSGREGRLYRGEDLKRGSR